MRKINSRVTEKSLKIIENLVKIRQKYVKNEDNCSNITK